MNANISFLEIKSLVSRWAEEYAIDEYEEMHFPFAPDTAGSQSQALWSLVDSGRVQSTRAIKARTGESVQRVAC